MYRSKGLAATLRLFALFENLGESAVQDYAFAYDFDGNGAVTYNGIVFLFKEI